MRFSTIAPLLAVAGSAASAAAGRPKDTPICDYYTTALLKDNTAKNQATLLTLLVNTVVIGNYTEPNVGVQVDGILAPGMYNGNKVNLMPYFDGTLKSTNRGGNMGESVNFLDGGGAAPLKKNMPAEDDSSMQYFLLTHLYQFFGSLLGCSEQGMPGFDAYSANPSMYEVHKFMDLDVNEVGYFVTQVGLAASSFGVADADVKTVGEALMTLFGHRCSPATTVIKSQGPQLQSICIDESCPVDENAMCSKYDMGDMMSSSSMMPYPTTSMPTSTMPSGTGSMTMTPTASPSNIPTGAAAANGVGMAAIAGGLAAFFI